jgi:1-acyl-sn-glycerol-3-phosphate acyltransferase
VRARWDDGTPQPALRLGVLDWLRVLRRGAPLVVLVFGGLLVLALVRLVERPLCGLRRPVTPYITKGVCKAAFVVIGMRRRVVGRPMPAHGAMVANHSSWLDIFALNASMRIYFVSKAEVARWPGIGWLARATGTVFIARRSTEARIQQLVFEARLSAGHKLMFFPEGTSTDGRHLLPFKSTLFAAFFSPALPVDMAVQPVSVGYHDPADGPSRFYGWWGDMDFGAHLIRVLAARHQGGVTVRYHAPLAVADVPDRKALATACERAVRAGLMADGISLGAPEAP